MWLDRQMVVSSEKTASSGRPADPAASASSADEGDIAEDTENAISEEQDESSFQTRFGGLFYPILLQ